VGGQSGVARFCILLTRRRPKCTLFPYTTLFRSCVSGETARRRRRDGLVVCELRGAARAEPRFQRDGGKPATPTYFDGPRRACGRDRKSTRLNSSHDQISYAVFCLKNKNRPAGLH